MSTVTLLCAAPLSPYTTPAAAGHVQSAPLETAGFSIQVHEYYRQTAEELGLEMKSYQYKLNLDVAEQDSQQLRDYLTQHGKPGEQVELWNLWVGNVNVRAFHPMGPLRDLDRDVLEQLFEKDQTCMTITI